MPQNSSPIDIKSSYWLYHFLPRKAIDYAQLMRLDRPIGRQLLFWPCLWGLALAYYSQGLHLGDAALPYIKQTDFLPVAWAHYHIFSPFGFFIFNAALFFIGALVMRGAGCVYNDIVDYKIDAKVARTATRPLPAGRVSRKQAWGFIGLLLLTGLAVLTQMNRFTLILGLCAMPIVVLYPFMKRISDWPQAVLGLAFNWGALLGFAALGNGLSLAALALYGGAILWTIGYDTIYAHQDREDDALIGVRSTARLFGASTKAALAALYGLAALLLLAAFAPAALAEGNFWPLIGVFAFAACLAGQIIRFDMNNAPLCLRLFKSNNMAGAALFAFAFIGLL